MADVKLEARAKSQKALTFTIPAAEIESEYGNKIAKYAKELTLKGFRKGKAPLSVVERQLGEYVREEVSFDLIEKKFDENSKTLAEGDQPLPYSTVKIENEDSLRPFKKDSDITVTVLYDAFPAVKLGQYKGLSFDVLNGEVSEKDIDAEVEKLREQNSDVITKEGKAEKGDIATVDYVQIDENGAEVENTKRNDFTFTIGSSYNQYKIDDDIIGMAAGDEKKITKTYDESESDESLRGRTITLSVKLTKLKERKLPVVDDEFAQDIKEEYKTVADLREGIRKDLTEQLDRYTEDEKYMKVFSSIIKSSEYEIPQSMIDFEIRMETRDYLRQIGRSAEEIDKLISAQDPMALYIQSMVAGRAMTSLNQQIIMDAVRKEGVIEVADSEIDEAVKDRINDQTSDEDKAKIRQEAKESLEFSKVPQYLIDNNTFNKTGDKLDFSSYFDAYYKEQEKYSAQNDEKEEAEAAEEEKKDN